MTLDKLRAFPTSSATVDQAEAHSIVLLRPEYALDDIRRMPFVIDHVTKVKGRRPTTRRTFWNPAEAFPDSPPDEQGTLCAGAYLLYRLQNPDNILTWILRDMPQDYSHCEIHFISMVESYAAGAARVSPSVSKHIARVADLLRDFNAERSKRRGDPQLCERIATTLITTKAALVA